MKPKSYTVTPVSDSDYFVASVTPSTSALTLVRGTIEYPHRLAVVFGGDSAKTLTVVGKDERGVDQAVVITSAGSGTVTTSQYFSEVLSITPSGAFSSTVVVGVSGLCVSAWLPVNRNADSFLVSLGGTLTGSATYSVEHTLDDVQDLKATIAASEHANFRNRLVAYEDTYCAPISALRLKVTAFTSGTVTLRVLQAG